MNTSSELLSPSEVAIQNRKFAKTCVEKKRRDRINKCLDELKEIMSQTDDKARYQKMEKAEILEMAVNYMRMSMSNGGKISQPTPDIYALAYNQLLTDFSHSLAMMPGMRDDFKAQLLGNLGTQLLRQRVVSSNKAPTTQPTSQPTQQPSSAQKKRRENAINGQQAAKRPCNVDQQYYMYNKYAGSCSSIDTTVQMPLSPCGSSSSTSLSYNGGDNQALNLSSSSSNSSPPISACSSPNSSSSLKSNEFTKIFRPYL